MLTPYGTLTGYLIYAFNSRRLCIIYSPSTVLILALLMTGYVTPQFDTKFNSARALSITAIVSTYILTFVILFI